MDPIDFVPHRHPHNVDVVYAPKRADLGKMREAGEVDALFSADVPTCVLKKSPHVGRLFDDYPVVERDYYRRTGIFPIMHTMVVARELAEKQPQIVTAVYNGLCEAKDKAVEKLVHGLTFNNMDTMIPWLSATLSDDRDLLGKDWWPYGVSSNRAAIDAVLRYHHEQGLTRRRFSVDEIFVPYLLDT